MSLADDLVTDVAEHLAFGPGLHAESRDDTQRLAEFLPDAASLTAVVLRRLGDECRRGTLWRFVDAAGFALLTSQIEAGQP